jgi:hypothetical protein
MRTIWLFAAIAAILSTNCAIPPARALQSESPNPNAKLAFFNESNLSQKMLLEYAVALQNAGLYNFKTENLYEEQLDNAIEIRLNYKEVKRDFHWVPILVLEAKLFKKGDLFATLNLKETGPETVYNPRDLNTAIKYRQKILLERFLEEIRRINAKYEEKNKA